MQKHYLEDLITPVVEGQGYELVRVLTMGGETHPTLQVMIDTLNGKNITVDDCAKVSRALSDVLDEKDPIKEKYSLEVSSPVLDRPLTKLAHFEKYAGYDVKLETEEKIDNRKRFKGKISKVVGQDIVLTDEKAEYIIPFTAINKAKLVVTDELWERYQASQEEAGEI